MAGLLDLPPELHNRIWFFIESLVPAHFNNDQAPLLSQVEDGNHIFQGKIFAWYNPHVQIQMRNQKASTTTHFFQPNITKVSKQTRSETLPIFYGTNTFLIADLYNQLDGFYTPFPKILWSWLRRIKVHVPLIRRTDFRCEHTQQTHEVFAALMDSEFDFKPTTL